MVQHRDIVIPEAGDYVLRRARVPLVFLDAKPEGAAPDSEGCALLDLHVAGGQLAAIEAAGRMALPGLPELDVAGRLVFATLVDMHAHLDKGQVIPRRLPDGTLDGGMIGTFEDRKGWTHADMHARMGFGLRAAYAHGVSCIRTHLDSQEANAELSWQVFEELRAEWAGRVELQAVGLVPLTFFRDDYGERLADRVLRAGGVLGGTTDAIGHYDGAVNEELIALLDKFFRIAGERGLDVDMHVDQSDDPAAFSLPLIAEAALRCGFRGRAVMDHCVNLALQPEPVLQRTIARCGEAGLTFVTMPTPMVYLQDRRPGRTPRWRGVTAVHELLAAGIPVAIGGDNCRDAWFPFGDHDMVDTLQQSVRIFQLDDPVATAVGMAGPVPSRLINEPSAGRLRVGSPARLILFAARSLNEFMCRPQADRIIINNGRRVTDRVPDYAELDPIMGEAAPRA
jgi:cytosine/creatinine deaminase